jgi:hypothetical protein
MRVGLVGNGILGEAIAARLVELVVNTRSDRGGQPDGQIPGGI